MGYSVGFVVVFRLRRFIAPAFRVVVGIGLVIVFIAYFEAAVGFDSELRGIPTNRDPGFSLCYVSDQYPRLRYG